jgi:AI-2 transport protein TqsA
MVQKSMNVFKLASILFIIAVIIFLLVIGKSLLIPIIVAFTIVFLINVVSEYLRRIKIGGIGLSFNLSTAAAAIVIIGVFFVFVKIIVETVELMILAMPAYQRNFEGLISQILELLELEEMPSLARIFREINLRAVIVDVGGVVSSFAGQLIIILIYVIFLLIEQRFFPRKLRAFFPEEDRFAKAILVLERINRSIKTYLTVKVFTSLLTGVLSYGVLRLIGLDFAIFWAFLIFAFNFIPSIGSIVATALPALFSILQFQDVSTFFLVLVSVAAVQLVVGNYLDPLLMGRSLNISPFVVLFSLLLWGSIWGVIGMLLCVPLMVSIMIILAQFKETLPLAVLLSAKGRILEEAGEEIRGGD